MPVLKVKHNGEWINVGGGASGGSNVNIDPTLTQSGSAADAKASGDAIRNLNTLVGNKPVAEQIQDAIGNLGGGGGEGIAVQADWDQTNSNELDFIRNKPFYDAGQPYEVSIFNQENMNFVEQPNMDESGTMNIYMPETYEEEMVLEKLQFIAGNTYTVMIDGTSQSAQAKSVSGLGVTYLGNLNLAISVFPSTGENFLIMPSEMMVIVNDSISSHNIAITETRLVVQKEIVPQNTYSFPPMNDIKYLNLTDFDFSDLKDGDLLIVNYDGKEYSCNVTAFEMGLIFGNGAMVGFYDVQNNEPFTGMYAEGMSGMYAYPTEIPFQLEKIISDTETEVIIPENTPYNIFIDEYISYDFTNPAFVIEPETSYKVFWNNVEYICISSPVFEQGEIELYSNTDDELPFYFVYCNDDEDEPYAYFEVYSGGPEILNKEIQITGLISGVKKIDKKYIPNDIDLPIASQNKVGGVKVRDTESGLGSRSDYTPIYLDTNDNQIYAKARSSMSTLTFTGATSGSYNGSSPVTINIPRGVPTVSTSDNGKVLGVVNGAWAKYDLPIQEMNPLTFTGLVEGTYDGSQALTINIPTGLPEVTDDNDGQILQVVDGAWVNNNPVFNYTIYIDQSDGTKYYTYVYNKEMIVNDGYLGIEVTTMPVKTMYLINEETEFVPDGIVVCSNHVENGYEEITDYTYTIENTAEAINVTINCKINDTEHSTIISLPFVNADTMFADFEYTKNDDGTYTLTSWKGTVNGVESAECVIPVSDLVLV